MNTTTTRRPRPANPSPENPVHEIKVTDMVTARKLLKALYLNLKSNIDKETTIDFRYDGTTTNVAFITGTTEMKFNLVEGGTL